MTIPFSPRPPVFSTAIGYLSEPFLLLPNPHPMSTFRAFCIATTLVFSISCTKDSESPPFPELETQLPDPAIKMLHFEDFKALDLQAKMQFDVWQINDVEYGLSMNSKAGDPIAGAEGVLSPFLIDSLHCSPDSIFLFGQEYHDVYREVSAVLGSSLKWQNDSCTIFVDSYSIDTLYLFSESDTSMKIEASSPEYYGSKYPIAGDYHYRYYYEARINKRYIIE